MIVVSAVTPVPEIESPTESFPEVTADTVNVVPEIYPVNDADAVPARDATAVYALCEVLTVYVPAKPVVWP